jgi:DNA-binding response OmpR family regulator
MRPGKKILLVGENEFTLSPLRYVLMNSHPQPIENTGTCYRVTAAKNSQEALNYLMSCEFDLMLLQLPITGIDDLLSRAKGVAPVLVLTNTKPAVDQVYSDFVLCNPPMNEFLERIKVMVARKRGPKPRKKAV